MFHTARHWLGLGAGCLLVTAVLASTVQAAPQQNSPVRKYGISNGSTSSTTQPGRWDSSARVIPPIGSDWRRTYPWSPYNAWSNPYWYPPYNRSYPYPPYQVYPYPIPPIYPYPLPQPYPVPVPYPGAVGVGLGR
jgi:hypothetical protein